MTERELEQFLETSVPCDRSGFQAEAGFTIDEFEGVLEIPIFKCHSDAHPQPKNRGLMKIPNDDPSSPEVWRIHDYLFVLRRHGKVCVHDKRTMGVSAGERFLRWCGQQLTRYRDVIVERIKDIITKKLPQ